MNFERRNEMEAKRNWRLNVKRHHEELREQEVPPTRRTRWDSENEFAVKEVPDFHEDCARVILCCFSFMSFDHVNMVTLMYEQHFYAHLN